MRRLCAVVVVAIAVPRAAAAATTVVYVGSSGSQDITVAALDASGALQQLQRIAVPGPPPPGRSLPLAVAPRHDFLFAGVRTQPFPVTTFSIDRATGKLAIVGTSSLADSMAYLSTDRTGKFLLGAAYD